MSNPLQIGLIGFGNIGAGVVRSLVENESTINRRLPRAIRLARIADLDTTTRRDAPYDPAILSSDTEGLLADPKIDVVIELMGGVEPARTFVEKALRAKKHVVTANKALLAEHGAELMELARTQGVALLFEASVGGGIPIIRALQQGLCANVITSIQGIINGTSNYILTQMEERGITFRKALNEAQAKGYAEPDPRLDIEGYDTAHKIAILASLAFNMHIRAKDVWVEGIKAIQPVDIQHARELGYAIKLLGIAKQASPGEPAEVRVHPTLVPADGQLAPIKGVYNAILVDGSPIGPTLFYGQGAGPRATSSAVISDLMAIASDANGYNIHRDGRLRIPAGERNIRPRDELVSNYYLRFTVADQPGTMARLSQALGDKAIGIESMIQHKAEAEAEINPTGGATVTIVTDEAVEKNVRECLAQIASTKINLADPFVLRVEE